MRLVPTRISAIARTAFWFIYFLSLTNIMAGVMRYVGVLMGAEQELGIYPVTFAICAALVLMFTKGQHHSPILVVSWIFWGIYTVGGFAGEYQLTGTYFRFVLEVIVKPWMTIVGLPWLALRAISEDKAPRLLQVTVLTMCVGSVLAMAQVAFPGFMGDLITEPGRGAGFLINPNHFGFMSAAVLFLSFIYPFERKWVNFTARMLLAAGLVATFSRAAILGVLISWIVYGIANKRFGALFKSLIAIAVVVAAVLISIEIIDAVSPQQAARLQAVRSFLLGDVANEETDNRTGLWQATFEIIVERQGVIQGLGHGSMERIVPVGGGLSPHNYYLLVWGNSGILASDCSSCVSFRPLPAGIHLPATANTSGTVSLATLFAVAHVFDHSLIGRPFPGALLACVVVAVAYGRARSISAAFSSALVEPDVPPGYGAPGTLGDLLRLTPFDSWHFVAGQSLRRPAAATCIAIRWRFLLAA